MKTVDKALSVLDQFSLSKTEIGLSELARLSGLDKAATRRLLVAMQKHGFIEQSAETRKYRLGHGFLRLANIREATVPIRQAAQDVADWLGAQTNETVHVSIPGPKGMITVAHRMPSRGYVININPAETLYYHATASGLVYLAFASPQTVDHALSLKREKLTTDTMIQRAEILTAIERFRAQGYSQTQNTYEMDVASIAMPFFREPGDPAGAIALALPRPDMTDIRRDALLPLLSQAVERLEEALTGLSPRVGSVTKSP